MIERRAEFRVRPDAVDDAVEAITVFVDAIARNEPNTLWYRSYQDIEDPTRFVHVMAFEDEDARTLHTETEHVRAFVERLYPLCEERPVFTEVRTVAEA